MPENYLAMLKESSKLDPKVFSLTRIKILHSLWQIHPDGITFREFSAGMAIQDGLLLQNLRTLGEMGYLRSERAEALGKILETFYLTELGKAIWSESREWLLSFIGEEAG
jgi:hypothetical protein